MTRAPSQAGDAESSSTPRLNFSVQTSINYQGRRVARVLLMWKHFQAGGLGAALRPQMGPGQSPGGAQGAKPPEANGFYTFTE